MSAPPSEAAQRSAALPRCDRTAAWTRQTSGTDAMDRQFAEAPAAKNLPLLLGGVEPGKTLRAGLLPRLATGGDLDGLDASTAGLIQRLRSA